MSWFSDLFSRIFRKPSPLPASPAAPLAGIALPPSLNTATQAPVAAPVAPTPVVPPSEPPGPVAGPSEPAGPPGPPDPGNHWEFANGGWMQVYTDPRIYNPDGTVKPTFERVAFQPVTGESFPPPTWAKELRKDGYWDSVADIWNPLVTLGPKAAWQGAADANVMGKVSTAAIQQYPEDRAAITLSYSYTEDHNRGKQ